MYGSILLVYHHNVSVTCGVRITCAPSPLSVEKSLLAVRGISILAAFMVSMQVLHRTFIVDVLH